MQALDYVIYTSIPLFLFAFLFILFRYAKGLKTISP